MRYFPKDAQRRFDEKVDRTDGADGCWNWTGATSSFGHGRVRVHGRLYSTHRIAAWQAGLISELDSHCGENAECVLHKCDNPRCVNPAHLFVGTRAVNNEDMRSKGRGEDILKHRASQQGYKNSSATVGPIDVVAIRGMHRRLKLGYQKIADRVGVSKTTVAQIVRRERYPTPFTLTDS